MSWPMFIFLLHWFHLIIPFLPSKPFILVIMSFFPSLWEIANQLRFWTSLHRLFKVIFNTLLVLVNGLLGMIFEHSQKKLKHLKYSLSGFSQLFQLCFHIAQKHIPNYIIHLLEMACLLAIVKLLGGFHIWYGKCFII